MKKISFLLFCIAPFIAAMEQKKSELIKDLIVKKQNANKEKILDITGLLSPIQAIIIAYLKKWEPFLLSPQCAQALSVSDDEDTIAVATTSTGTVSVFKNKSTDFDTEITLEIAENYKNDKGKFAYLSDIALSPDGKNLAIVVTLNSWNPRTMTFSNALWDHIEIWNPETKQRTTELYNHRSRIEDIQFSPDGKYLASVSSDRSLAVVQTNDWKLMSSIEDRNDYIYGCKMIFDLPQITVFTTNNIGDKESYLQTIVLDIETGKYSTKRNLVGLDCKKISVLPDKKSYVLHDGYYDTSVNPVWVDMQTGDEINFSEKISMPNSGKIEDIVFSQNGKYFATDAFGATAIWDSRKRELLQMIDQPHKDFNFVTQKPDKLCCGIKLLSNGALLLILRQECLFIYKNQAIEISEDDNN